MADSLVSAPAPRAAQAAAPLPQHAGDVVMPGDELGEEARYEAGDGTYVHEGRIYASVVGHASVLPLTSGADAAGSDAATAAAPAAKLGTVVVLRERAGAAIVPAPGHHVIARITRITHMHANADILCVNGRALSQPFSGVVRRENVRETEVDKVRMEECFAPGDLVAATVVSLGTTRDYFLSTAAPELGVVYARLSDGGSGGGAGAGEGEVLMPVSWSEMEAPGSKKREKRKVARPAGV
jgi:exosome complex component CSL4